jgi:hypothetical protein
LKSKASNKKSFKGLRINLQKLSEDLESGQSANSELFRKVNIFDEERTKQTLHESIEKKLRYKCNNFGSLSKELKGINSSLSTLGISPMRTELINQESEKKTDFKHFNFALLSTGSMNPSPAVIKMDDS